MYMSRALRFRSTLPRARQRLLTRSLADYAARYGDAEPQKSPSKAGSGRKKDLGSKGPGTYQRPKSSSGKLSGGDYRGGYAGEGGASSKKKSNIGQPVEEMEKIDRERKAELRRSQVQPTPLRLHLLSRPS